MLPLTNQQTCINSRILLEFSLNLNILQVVIKDTTQIYIWNTNKATESTNLLKQIKSRLKLYIAQHKKTQIRTEILLVEGITY